MLLLAHHCHGHMTKMLFTPLIALAACALAAPAGHIVHERRAALPAAWEKESQLSARAILPMRIGLAQSNLDRGHDMLMDV